MELHYKKLRRGLILIAMLLVCSMASYVFASLLNAPSWQIEEQPKILGSLTLAINVDNVYDLYTWQVVITFNPKNLKVLETLPGEFLGVDSPFFVNASDLGDDILLLGGTLYGDVAGKNGSGRLATVVFGFYTENFEPPRIVRAMGCFETFLLDSRLALIPIEEGALTLSVLEVSKY